MKAARTMLFETNGHMLIGRRTKHVNARYFMLADRVASGEVEVDHYPAERMWDDILNQSKQGTMYRIFRDELMNKPEL